MQIAVHSAEINILKDNLAEAKTATTILKTDFEGIKLAVFLFIKINSPHSLITVDRCQAKLDGNYYGN